MRRRVEQDRSQRHVDRDVDRADERHVDRPVGDLRRGAGEIHGHRVAFDGHRHLDPLVALGRVGIVGEAVDIPLGAVRAVRELLDLLAQHPLGVGHELLAGRLDRLPSPLLEQLDVALRADVAGGDLGLHVADDHVAGADVVPHQPPDDVVLDPPVVDLEGLELEPLRVGVHGVDDAARARELIAPTSRWCAVVKLKPTSSSSKKIGTQNPTSGSCEAP